MLSDEILCHRPPAKCPCFSQFGLQFSWTGCLTMWKSEKAGEDAKGVKRENFGGFELHF